MAELIAAGPMVGESRDEGVDGEFVSLGGVIEYEVASHELMIRKFIPLRCVASNSDIKRQPCQPSSGNHNLNLRLIVPQLPKSFLQLVHDWSITSCPLGLPFCTPITVKLFEGTTNLIEIFRARILFQSPSPCCVQLDAESIGR